MRAPSVVLAFLLVVCGCHDLADPPTVPQSPSAAPTAPTVPAAPPTQVVETPNWKGDATVVSVVTGSATACGWGTSAGEVRSSVGWAITVSGDSISLDEDTRNWPTDDIPFSGHLNGAQFTASYRSAPDYARYVCPFREAALTGQFTSDSTFDADETLIWGAPGSETTVRRHWTGLRL